MINIKGRKYLFPTALNYSYSIFCFILIGVISICGCANKGLRKLDLTDNSIEKGFVEFCPNYANKAKYPSKFKLLVYKYNKRGTKLFSEPVGSGIRLIERPGMHTYFVKITGSARSEKVIVDVVDKMITPVMIDVDFGPTESKEKWDTLRETRIKRIKQYFKMRVSIRENIPINRYPQTSASGEETLKKDIVLRIECEKKCKRMFERGELKKGMSIEECISILCK
jgi:hypothetical protein